MSFSVYRKSIIDEIDGLRTEFNGAQDYDFTLRFTEKAKKSDILIKYYITGEKEKNLLHQIQKQSHMRCKQLKDAKKRLWKDVDLKALLNM